MPLKDDQIMFEDLSEEAVVVYIDKDELWPYHSVTFSPDLLSQKPYVLPKRIVMEYRKAQVAFIEARDILIAALVNMDTPKETS